MADYDKINPGIEDLEKKDKECKSRSSSVLLLIISAILLFALFSLVQDGSLPMKFLYLVCLFPLYLINSFSKQGLRLSLYAETRLSLLKAVISLRNGKYKEAAQSLKKARRNLRSVPTSDDYSLLSNVKMDDYNRGLKILDTMIDLLSKENPPFLEANLLNFINTFESRNYSAAPGILKGLEQLAPQQNESSFQNFKKSLELIQKEISESTAKLPPQIKGFLPPLGYVIVFILLTGVFSYILLLVLPVVLPFLPPNLKPDEKSLFGISVPIAVVLSGFLLASKGRGDLNG
ncbi:Uncharacterised protein [Candidatus Gugararchaeum adminiculabundum]|nr:Uncharacterised protein [Candidatus Gugararchaeum adminiculabundum]